jgi:hypothetical protein
MKLGWFIAALVVWIISAACIIGTIYECVVGKANLRKADFWGGIAFHGGTAIIALWLLLKALGKM